MTADKLEELLELGQAPVVLDVRSAPEYKSGHIKGAVHSPLPGLLKSAAAAIEQKTDTLLLVCEHGPRAQVGAMYLKFRGYKAVELLDGHMSSWRSSGRPVDQTD
jgi:hydroxyacylglutathione hydrolase